MQDQRTFDVTRLAAGMVLVELDDASGDIELIEVAAGLFEPAEYGVAIGRVFVPWHRVRRYSWGLGTHEIVAGERPPLARVRVVLDDGTVEGEAHVVAGDRFETGPYVVTVVLDELVDIEKGVVTRRKLCVPWSHVIEFERLRVDDATVMHAKDAVPERPDGA